MLATFDHAQFEPGELLGIKTCSVTVCIPTRMAAATIGATVEAVMQLRELGLVDQLIVIDANSSDDTASIARRAGADVFFEEKLLPEFGPVQGKGDAMWRALSVSSGEIVVYVDGDVRDFGPHYVVGLLGPLLTSGSTAFAKGFYRRPFALEGIEIEDGGGRVTELTARPLLELVAPQLTAFHQPLSGECAAYRSLLEDIPYYTGYGVEISMLIEVAQRIGIDRMAQVGLGSKRNSHQVLSALNGMARDVIEALARQTGETGASETGTIAPASSWKPRLAVRPPFREVTPRRAEDVASPRSLS